MTTITDTRLQLEQLDLQIIRLLEDRVQLCAEARERDEGLDTRDVEVEMISLWLEEALDRGLDEAAVERMAMLVTRMCRGEEE